MIIQKISAYPVKNGLTDTNASKKSEKFTNLNYEKDSFTCCPKPSFKGLLGGGFGLGVGGLVGLIAASATGVGIPAAIAMLAAGEAVGAAAGSKVGDALSDGKDSF